MRLRLLYVGLHVGLRLRRHIRETRPAMHQSRIYVLQHKVSQVAERVTRLECAPDGRVAMY